MDDNRSTFTVIAEIVVSETYMSTIPETPLTAEDRSFSNSHLALRKQGIKLAVLTSLISKGISGIVQIIALPIAIRALGVERFAIYAMLASSLGWLSFAGIGVGPGLTRGIANSVAREDRDSEKSYFATAFFVDLAVTIALALLLAVILFITDPHLYFGKQYQVYDAEIRANLFLLAALALLQLVIGGIEAAQAGYQDQYILNLWVMLGNALSVVALLSVAFWSPSIMGLVLAVYGTLVFARCINAFRFIAISRPYLTPKVGLVRLPLLKELVGVGTSYTVVQIAGFLCNQFSIFLVGRNIDAKAAAAFAVVMQIIILGASCISMISQPLWPALMDAVARQDMNWVRFAYRRVIVISMIFAMLVGVTLAFAGQPVISHWYSKKVIPSISLQMFMGLYFVLISWEAVHYIVLSSLKLIWPPAIAMAFRSICFVPLALVLMSHWGAAGTAMALCLTTFLSTTWIFPIWARNSIKMLETQHSICAT